ncbi:MAG: Nif3-like dinuclear metal center hexameric protein [Oscillospiraceae bacterium]|jgi:dinuclear metal center YbgI/SA1388 family protein|nr:Nif3-like dinuclear metal center hexameric protein [Oscillospiraceae bacterium]
MCVKVREIYEALDKIAPFDTAMDCDNVGLLVGDENAEVSGVVVSLDVTQEVIEEAVRKNANLIISHHPVIFKPIKSCLINDIPYMAIKNEVNIICAHTNLDFAERGVCRCLADVLGVKNLKSLGFYKKNGNNLPYGLIGEIEVEMSSKEFASYVKRCLNCEGLRYTESKKSVKTVALCSGGAGEFIFEAISKHVDAYVTGEIKHHEILEAVKNDITVVDAGHFNTEDIAMAPLVCMLADLFKEVKFSKSEVLANYRKYI